MSYCIITQQDTTSSPSHVSPLKTSFTFYRYYLNTIFFKVSAEIIFLSQAYSITLLI